MAIQTPSGSVEIETTANAVLSLNDLVDYVDEQVAAKFLGLGKGGRILLNNDQMIYAKGKDSSKILIAKKSILKPEKNMASLKRCIAACALYCITKEYGTKDKFQRKQEAQVSNSLADAHGFHRDTNLYYLYNAGFDFMAEKFPVMSLALLAWKRKYRVELFKTADKGEVSTRENLDDYKQIMVYYEAGAKNVGMSLDEYIKNIANKAEQDEGLKTYLKGLKPTMTGGRELRSDKFDIELDKCMKNYFN